MLLHSRLLNSGYYDEADARHSSVRRVHLLGKVQIEKGVFAPARGLPKQYCASHVGWDYH